MVSLFATLLVGAQGLSLQSGTLISTSVKLKPGVYVIGSPSDLSKPAVQIRGNNLTLDFKGVVLRGTTETTEPDQRKGIGIRVTGKNITIKNLRAHGYKVALFAEKCENLKLIDSDLSFNWKQKLASTPEKEDLSDWMSFHENDKDQWLRYGAAAYFKDVNKFEVKNTQAMGGQCGLMLTRSNNGLVWNSNFSYLSAIGVGMFRSSNNRVMHNNINFCVRGYSHGVYNRGQDSAGILVYEQSNKNVFAYNSVTHGGDGFFLWAGQTTMDTGKGGCNDNLVFGNDFSFAPTNGIEATFSRNRFVNNLIEGCWHGFWTGYSYNTTMSGNHIIGNEEGIAHEHGQNNIIDSNQFLRNKLDVNIWANEKQDPNWGYPKTRNTESKGWMISDNTFHTLLGKTLKVRRTNDLVFSGNTTFEASYDVDATSKGIRLLENCMHTAGSTLNVPEGAVSMDNKLEHLPSKIDQTPWIPVDDEDVFEADSPDPLKGGKMPFAKMKALRSREFILVDEWGPYDFKAPKIREGKVGADGWQKLSILGPKGQWKMLSHEGIETKSVKGDVPGSVMIRPVAGESRHDLQLEYVGGATTDYRGITTPAGRSVKFNWSKSEVAIDFDVRFFPWIKDSQDPRTNYRAYDRAAALAEGVTLKTTKLDFAGYGKFAPGVPASYFGTIAKGSFSVAPGEYELEVTADDGIEVVIDNQELVKAWKYQGPTLYKAKVKLGGKHTIYVNHFQIDGYAALQLKLKPVKK